MKQARICGLESVGRADINRVGGKNASLGELIRELGNAGVRVPGGFATTTSAYREFLDTNRLAERIAAALATLDVNDLDALSATGASIRQWIIETPLPMNFESEIREAYRNLGDETTDVAVAVRSSATAEDLADASFAGQQETFLNVSGVDAVLRAVTEVFASLYNDRAIAYRHHKGYHAARIALSAGIQLMVRSDIGASGVMFTLDTESGFEDVVLINAAYGLGETVVQGQVDPDEYYVYKPALARNQSAILRRQLGSKAVKMIYGTGNTEAVTVIDTSAGERGRFALTDSDVEALARYAVQIEAHYGQPMDIEWGKDGQDQNLYILQARPETVKSRERGVNLERFELAARGEVLATGRSVGQKIGSGTARIISDLLQMESIRPGDVLVTTMTDPDWEPIMERAAAIVTDRGGRTCHAAIIARELGVPAIVGTQDGTTRITDGDPVTVSCAEGDTGYVYRGELAFERREIRVDNMPDIPFKITMNIANPERAFTMCRLPNAGVGLARLEFIIGNTIGVHPRALLEFDALDGDLKAEVAKRIAGYADPVTFYVNKLTEGIGTLAAAFSPHPVIVRLSDFKSDEYANLLGGSRYEPVEANPMLGFRGASRYVADSFRECFELECRALRLVRGQMGLTNVEIMVPFVRTLDEADAVVELLAENGLRRGENGLRLIMMCEIPSNAILADEFLTRFDGFSIGSNDLTQMTLGLDRNSGLVASLFDERNPAVKRLLHDAIQACRRADKYVGICGQGPSDYPDLAQWLMDEGITSVSLNPDSIVETWLYLAGQVA
ncbi:MAG: phosphoenolpyruvate synthase [Gammaproteobacteria bacterium]|nr:phosphoenolpyruvate synthase [Gammaproteobacteria bacterium]MDH3465773.1 phosphoenolpyruvate synthase [Gammaproteobacteria bacterium]